jgi:PST family polysaccharide transporter
MPAPTRPGTPRGLGTLSLGHAVVALSATNALAVAAPLATMPYLARTLGANAWGSVLLAQALVAWVALLLDFASDLDGARAVGSAPMAEQAGVVWGVQAGKLLLVPAALVLTGVAVLLLPPLRENPPLAASAAVAALARGVSPLWAFVARSGGTRPDGTGPDGAPPPRLRAPLLVDTLSRVVAALGVIPLVHHPAHGWRVLALQAGAGGAALGWLWWMLWRELPPPMGWHTRAWRSLSRARALFAFRALGAVYQSGSLLLLGALAPVATVAAYGAADRLVRAALNLLDPLSRALLPRLARWQAEGDRQWEDTVAGLLRWMGAGSLVAAALVGAAAPLLVSVAFGAGYDSVVPSLRALASLMPLVTVGTVLGYFWALPARRDGVLLRGTALAGAVNLMLVAALVPTWGAHGMAGAVLAAEGVMVAVLASAYRQREWVP